MTNPCFFIMSIPKTVPSLLLGKYQNGSFITTEPKSKRAFFVRVAVILVSPIPTISIVSLVRGIGMSVQEQAAPVSTSISHNRPPRLALILIRFPLLDRKSVV